MTTAADIINLSLKQAGVLGVGQAASAEDVNDAMRLMNQMLAQWQRRRWLVYHLVDSACPATGAEYYTVGIGEDFNIARPDGLEDGCFFRQTVNGSPYPVDYPLEILQSREDYSKIRLKNLNSFPQYIYYDAAYPVGKVYVWPLPSNLYTVHILVKAQLQSFSTLADNVLMPPEYEEALMYNLAVRLCPMYGLPIRPDINMLAQSSLNTLKMANAQIARLRISPTLLNGRGHYNIFSDTSY